jgi:hypothetical protein
MVNANAMNNLLEWIVQKNLVLLIAMETEFASSELVIVKMDSSEKIAKLKDVLIHVRVTENA